MNIAKCPMKVNAYPLSDYSLGIYIAIGILLIKGKILRMNCCGNVHVLIMCKKDSGTGTVSY